MAREKYIVGNWKMNQTLAEIEHFFASLKGKKRATRTWVAPQAMHLKTVMDYANMLDIRVGAQNCADHQFGAYTGELSPFSLKDLGVHFTLIGHSERRQIYGESDELLNAKTLQALQSGLRVIFCVGETLEEREAGKTKEVVAHQILNGLKDISEKYRRRVKIAYEPVWAIGTGKTATSEQAQEVHAFIRHELLSQVQLEAKETIILYGGSVKPSNIKELLSQNDIDGALVGGASLKAEEFLQLCM